MIRRKLLYILLLYLALVFNVLYGTYDGYLLMILGISLPVLFFLILFVQRFCIKVRFKEENRMVRRQEEYVTELIVRNPTPFPVTCAAVTIEGSGKKKRMEFGVAAFSSEKVKYYDRDEHCGCHFLKADKIYIYDFFKLFRLRIRGNSVVKIEILPRLFGVDEEWGGTSLCSGESEAYSPDRPGDDFSEVFDVREYRFGDREQYIHWKLTCRLNRLMVKEYSMPKEREFFFSIAMLSGRDERERSFNDLMLEAMYMVMHSTLGIKNNIWGLFCWEEEGEYGPVSIKDEEELDVFFGRLIEAGEKNRSGLVRMAEAGGGRSRGVLCHFAAELPEREAELLYRCAEENEILVYVPFEYKESVLLYRDTGIRLVSAQLRGGDRLWLEDI